MSVEKQRWASKVLDLNYSIGYKTGTENRIADALSRRPQAEQIMELTLTAPISLDREELAIQLEADPELKKLITTVREGKAEVPGYHSDQGLLFKDNRLVIPVGSSFIPTLLEQFHSSEIGGHEGVLKTFKRLAREVFWKGMIGDVVEHITKCQICQQNKYSTLTLAGLLSLLPIPTQVWADISLDFVEGLPISKGFDVILVVVDRLSIYAHVIPLKHPFSAKSVAEIFVKEVVKLHGFPKTMVSDRDKVFLSQFWTALFKS